MSTSTQATTRIWTETLSDFANRPNYHKALQAKTIRVMRVTEDEDGSPVYGETITVRVISAETGAYDSGGRVCRSGYPVCFTVEKLAGKGSEYEAIDWHW